MSVFKEITTYHESDINSPFINRKSVHLNVTGRPTILFLVLLVHIDLFCIATPVVPKPGVPGSRNDKFGGICELYHNKTTKISFSILLFELSKSLTCWDTSCMWSYIEPERIRFSESKHQC